MAKRTTTKIYGVEMTQSEFDYLKTQAEDAESKVLKLQEDLRKVANDGCNDENPAYAQVKTDLVAAHHVLTNIRERIATAVILKPEPIIEGVISLSAKKITLRCTYDPEDIEEKVFVIGHEVGDLTPSSPLFTFLNGKSVGYKGTFSHTTKMDTYSYDIEILGVEF